MKFFKFVLVFLLFNTQILFAQESDQTEVWDDFELLYYYNFGSSDKSESEKYILINEDTENFRFDIRQDHYEYANPYRFRSYIFITFTLDTKQGGKLDIICRGLEAEINEITKLLIKIREGFYDLSCFGEKYKKKDYDHNLFLEVNVGQ